MSKHSVVFSKVFGNTSTSSPAGTSSVSSVSMPTTPTPTSTTIGEHYSNYDNKTMDKLSPIE